jgi:tetratricopeptide (TPR) repeat protein
MIGPNLKPVNFPMEIQPYTDGLFIISGILQVFWVIPMIMRWGFKWYLAGLIGTIGLSILLLITRIPNGLTDLPLEDRNPMALLTELSQLLYIGSTLMVIIYSRSNNAISLHLESRRGLESKSIEFHDNGDEDDIVLSAHAHCKDGNSEDTVYLLKKLEYRININSRDSKLWIARGIALRQLGGNNEAIQSFDEAIRLDPTKVAAWYQKGLSLNILGLKKEAIQIYEIARLIKKSSQNQDSRKLTS